MLGIEEKSSNQGVHSLQKVSMLIEKCRFLQTKLAATTKSHLVGQEIPSSWLLGSMNCPYVTMV